MDTPLGAQHQQRLPALLVVLLMVLPWVQPWAPGPEPNTVPVLLSWATLALLLALGRWPSAHALAQGVGGTGQQRHGAAAVFW